jgi:hypothetical protein
MPSTIEVPTFLVAMCIIGVVALLMQKDPTIRYMRKTKRWSKLPQDVCGFYDEQRKREEVQCAEYN